MAKKTEWRTKAEIAEDKKLLADLRAIEAAKAAYYAIPEDFRDECVDRENAFDGGHTEGSVDFWTVMRYSAESRKQAHEDEAV